MADELAARRKGAVPTTPSLPNVGNPLQIDPFRLYGGYPSHRLQPTDTIASRGQIDEGSLAALDALNGRALYGRKIMPDVQMLALSGLIADNGPLTLEALEELSPMARPQLQAGLLFLAKYDLVTITPQGTK